MIMKTVKYSSNRLQVINLCKSFILHNRGAVRINGFSDLSFSLNSGELLALTGQSGAGKSSVLKTIYRTYRPGGGQILFHRDGQTIDLAACTDSEMLKYRLSDIGFVTQFLKILPRVSAMDVVAAPLIALGENPESAREQAARLLRRLYIREDLFGISPLTFSGGEQQRVNIARGVIVPRKLLLLDEPTASLDDKSAVRVLEILHDLKKQGSCILAIFHDRQRMLQVADNELNITG